MVQPPHENTDCAVQPKITKKNGGPGAKAFGSDDKRSEAPLIVRNLGTNELSQRGVGVLVRRS